MPTTRDIILPLGALELSITTDDGITRLIPVPAGATRLTLTFDVLAAAAVGIIRLNRDGPRLSWAFP